MATYNDIHDKLHERGYRLVSQSDNGDAVYRLANPGMLQYVSVPMGQEAIPDSVTHVIMKTAGISCQEYQDIVQTPPPR